MLEIVGDERKNTDDFVNDYILLNKDLSIQKLLVLDFGNGYSK